MNSRANSVSFALHPVVRAGLICLLLGAGLTSIGGCSNNSSNGGGPEVLQKKYPGGGSPGQARPAGAAKTEGTAPTGG